MPDTTPPTNANGPRVIWVLALICMAGMLYLMPWTYRSIAGAWIGVALCIAIGFVLWNKYATIVCGVLGVASLVRAVILMPLLFPASVPVEKMELKDTTVAEALGILAKQKQDTPYWRFFIQDEELADTRISLNVPENGDLGSALDQITARCGANWKWRWHKPCGNAPFPLCVKYYVFREGSEADPDFRNWRVMVNQDEINRFGEPPERDRD